MIVILDACTAINFVHIDEDEFLLRKLKMLDFHLCKKVFDEIYSNVFNKLHQFHPYPEARHKKIALKLNYFRERIHSDLLYLDLAQEISKETGYFKTNGEFFSVLLSVHLNTWEKRRIFFFTDDTPATKAFEPYYLHNRIGFIEDSVDLLILLYRHNEDFNIADLSKFLHNLYSEYASDMAALEKVILAFEIPRLQIRNAPLKIGREKFISYLKELNVEMLQDLYFNMLNDKKTYESLLNAVSRFDIFLKQKVSNNYLKKIKDHILLIERRPFYKYLP